MMMQNVQVQNGIPAPIRPRDYNASQLALIKRTVAKDCNDDEFNMFMEICRRQGLDPFRRQIYAFVFNKENAKKRQFVTVTGIDGYRAIAKRTGTYRASDRETLIEYDEAKKDPESNPLGIVKATTVVYQFGPDKQWYPIIGTAYWDEFAPIEDGYTEENRGETWPDGNPKKTRVPNGKKKLGKENWRTMGIVMISKCSEAQALRKGWPEEFSGLYVFEEMDRAQAEHTASEQIAQFEEEQRIQAVGGRDSFPMMLEPARIEMIPAGQMADRVLERVRQFPTSTEIDIFVESNKSGLQQYWAKNKSEALELKRQIEAIQKAKPAHIDYQQQTA
jgi:phage recombination protein Bet